MIVWTIKDMIGVSFLVFGVVCVVGMCTYFVVEYVKNKLKSIINKKENKHES